MCNNESAYRTSEPVVSISWHAHHEHQLLTCTNSGIVQLLQLQESSPICFGPSSNLAFSTGTAVAEVVPGSSVASRCDGVAGVVAWLMVDPVKVWAQTFQWR